MGKFAKQLAKFEAMTMERFVKVKRGSIIDLSTSIVMSTPVDKGHLRNNWFASAQKTTYETTTYAAPVGVATINRVKQVMKKVDHIVPVFIVNNLHYSIPIEFDGHSRKAPTGMVRVNTARWVSIVNANVEKFKK